MRAALILVPLLLPIWKTLPLQVGEMQNRVWVMHIANFILRKSSEEIKIRAHFAIINKYSSSPNGLWINSPWGFYSHLKNERLYTQAGNLTLAGYFT